MSFAEDGVKLDFPIIEHGILQNLWPHLVTGLFSFLIISQFPPHMFHVCCPC